MRLKRFGRGNLLTGGGCARHCTQLWPEFALAPLRCVKHRIYCGRNGVIAAFRDRDLTIIDTARLHWKLPYVATEPPTDTPELEELPLVAAPPKMTRDDLAVGDQASVTDKYLATQVGTVVSVNQKSATLDCDGTRWRVGFSLLRHAIDIA